ncbi:DNA-binding protein RFX5 [Liparis tanakae]|uniref:DNA-binding protein RFX5 n=1 Tax=Liparis tanakae TaxID=230148 RepID=A0A4Z2FEC4_9TELE|nr:DNA-binding protein RFX5 [Liparis tanakae]
MSEDQRVEDQKVQDQKVQDRQVQDQQVQDQQVQDRRVEASRRGDGSLEGGEGDTEPSMLLQKLKSNISVAADCSSFNTADQLHTCNWIRSHLEEHGDTCLPKQDVYETYRRVRYCENLQHRPLSAANFGKIIRDIFPNIKARRLGGRGQSKYPSEPRERGGEEPRRRGGEEAWSQSTDLICDWAQKILKRSFDTVVEIARHLVHEHVVNPRCSQAELVASAALAGGPAKTHKVIKKAPPASKAESDGADHKVEAFMKQLPRILPRSSAPEKTQLSVRSSPPSLAPKDAPGAVGGGGGVKVIAVAALPQQQGVPVMILPQGCLSYEREKIAPPPPLPPPPPAPLPQHAAPAPKPRGNGNKRPPEAAGASAAPPVKRKRGRPRKPRPEDAPPPPPPAALSPKPLPHPPIITSLTGGVIQKASSSSSSSSQPVLELVIQDPRLVEHRGVVVQCRPAAAPEPERRGRPLLLFQSAGGGPGWERTPMVEVIQKAPRPGHAHLHPLAPPPPHEERREVEMTLTPVHLNPSSSSSSVCSVTVVKSEEEEAESAVSSKTEAH